MLKQLVFGVDLRFVFTQAAPFILEVGRQQAGMSSLVNSCMSLLSILRCSTQFLCICYDTLVHFTERFLQHHIRLLLSINARLLLPQELHRFRKKILKSKPCKQSSVLQLAMVLLVRPVYSYPTRRTNSQVNTSPR